MKPLYKRNVYMDLFLCKCSHQLTYYNVLGKKLVNEKISSSKFVRSPQKWRKTLFFSQSLLVNKTQSVTGILLFFSSLLSRIYLISHPRQSLPRHLSKSSVENFDTLGKLPTLNEGLCQALRLAVFSFSDGFAFFLGTLSLCFLESSGCQEFSEETTSSPGLVTHFFASVQILSPSGTSVSQGKTFYLPPFPHVKRECCNSVPAYKLADDSR